MPQRSPKCLRKSSEGPLPRYCPEETPKQCGDSKSRLHWRNGSTRLRVDTLPRCWTQLTQEPLPFPATEIKTTQRSSNGTGTSTPVTKATTVTGGAARVTSWQSIHVALPIRQAPILRGLDAEVGTCNSFGKGGVLVRNPQNIPKWC